MNLSDTKRFCLQHLPITLWQTRQAVVYQNLVLHQEPLSAEKRALLDRMLLALQWQQEQTSLLPYANNAELLTQLRATDCQFVLILGCEQQTGEIIAAGAGKHIAAVPALDAMLKNPQAKRQAWQAMQQTLLKKQGAIT